MKTLGRFAQKAIDKGVAYICTWGEGCERMHDIFDETVVWQEVSKNKEIPCIVTTWHTNDSLDEALWFALNNTHPDDFYFETCKSVLVTAVENKDFDKHLRLLLSDIEKFNKDILRETN